MCSKWPWINCLYVGHKWMRQRPEYTIVKKNIAYVLIRASNELNGEMQAAVQRSLTV